MKKFTILTSILLCMAWMAYGQWTYTSLSEPKAEMGFVSLGTKAYFAGGSNGSQLLSDVESYDVLTGTWETIGNLSVARQWPTAVACGTKLFFAGGMNFAANVVFNTVDIYDTETQQWSVKQLSVARFDLAAVSYGNKVLFAGGITFPYNTFSIVDIYDCETGEWLPTANLTQQRGGIARAVTGDLAIFAGGSVTASTTSDNVDIYNFTTNTWTSATLSQAKMYAIATTVGDKVIIGGGCTAMQTPTSRVDIYDATNNTWSTSALSVGRAWLGTAATVNGHAYFPGGGNFNYGFNSPSDVIDIWDEASGSWATDALFEPIHSLAMLGVGNYLVVGGGVTGEGNRTSLVQVFHDRSLILVPEDYTAIQEGINASSDGDTVLVSEGTFYENINYNGKAIVVASEFLMDGDTNHINNTIINGSQPVNPDIGAVVAFASGEDTTSVLCGFTITGGTGTDIPGVVRMGGGVFLTESGGKLLNNHIEYNSSKGEGWSVGGGIGAGGPTSPLPWVVLRNNRINHNEAESVANDRGEGGGVLCFYNMIMTDNVISYNKATGGSGGLGGGVYIRGDMATSWFNFSRNILTYNEAIANSSNSLFSLGGGFVIYQSYGIAAGNLFAFNVTESPSGIDAAGSGVYIQEVPDSELVFENNLILNNSFIGDVCLGGGVCLWMTGGTYQNNVIQNNKGTKGGGIFIGSSTSDTAILINNTITANDAGGGGTGLHISSSNAVVINSILYNNTPPGPAIFDETSSIEVRYSDVEDDEVWPGEGNVNCSPSFLEDGYHLDPSCQLLNAGITTIEVNGVWYNCPALDIDGEPRPFAGTQPEIGVDELQTTVAVGKPISSNPLTINVFPNPATQKVMFDVAEGTAIHEVNIYTQTGQKVFTGAPENSMLDVSALQPGIYFIEIFTDQSKIDYSIKF